jgi:hypothetical protein
VLQAADEAVWSCYQQVFTQAEVWASGKIKRGAAPLPFIESVFSPAAYPSETFPRKLYDILNGTDFLFTGRGQGQQEVLHLVATAIATPAGVRLRMAGADPYAQQTVQQDWGELLRADELAERFPHLAVCVLQAMPGLGGEVSDQFREADREQTAYLRLFAAELVLAGVPAVVTLPPLPAAVAWEALVPFATAIKAQDQDSVTALIQAVRDAQLVIISPRHLGGNESRIEAAFDVCLYAFSEGVQSIEITTV